MGIDKLSTVYGRIIIGAALDEAKKFINTMKLDRSYPYIQKEMFNTCWEKEPWGYESQIIGFCANYKRAEESWNSFIIKFEYILENLNHFESASLELETFYYGKYNFHWSNYGDFGIGQNGIKHKTWFFQQGHEGEYGMFHEQLNEKGLYDLGLKYPVEFPAKVYEPFKAFIQGLEEADIGKKIYLSQYLDESISTHDYLGRILTYLEIYKELEFGWENGGRWIKLNRAIAIE